MENQITTKPSTNRRNQKSPAKPANKWFTAGAGVLVAAALTTGARAQTADPLLNTLIKKGILTEEEAKSIKAEAEASQAKNTPPSYSKWKIGSGFKNIELYGDIRLRFEDRLARTPIDDRLELQRLRYSLRFGVRGELYDDFYFGFRMDTAANPRSAWVTFGTSSSGVPYQGPFGKSTAGLNLSQIYLGWKPESWVDLTFGKMANPLYNTTMVWDSDLNPEGLAERFKYTVGEADLFANFGQFLYQDVNPTHSGAFLVPSIPAGQDANLPFLLAWQLGANYHLKKDMSLKFAGTLYNYTGHGQNTVPGGVPAVPGFRDAYVGEGAGVPVNGASGYPTGPNGGFAFNQTGINDLLIIDFPVEFNFKLGKLNARVFGDYAQNLNGSDRAAAAVAGGLTNNPLIVANIPLQKNENKAYQAGFALGNGDTLGAFKKGVWEARTYWQHVEQYALDPNLLDSDYMEGRGNLQGISAAFTYNLTDALYMIARYGYATRINNQLGTGGANQDIPQVNPIKQYQIFQLDLGCRF